MVRLKKIFCELGIYKVLAVIMFPGILFFYSCQKVVNIDLNDASPKLVIEGVIDNGPGPYRVKVSRTGSYFNQPVLPAVSGALVIVSDNTGTMDTLTEDSTGIYFTHKIKGVPGNSYMLSVFDNNIEYTGFSTMMSAVNIDSLGVQIIQRISFGLRNRRDSSLTVHFKDPVDEKNYYRVKLTQNRVSNSENYRLYDDAYTNGQEINLRVGRANARDTDIIQLISLDKSTYDYYRTLEDILRINPIFGSTPANPNTNLTSGALGYFAAIAITKTSIIIP